MMTLSTFPMTVQVLHTTGANIVRCPALGTQQVFITDCFGRFVEAPCLERLMHAIEGNGSH